MKNHRRFAYLLCILTLTLLSCGLLTDLANLAQEVEDVLPIAPLGGTPVQVVAIVEFDYRESIAGDELIYSTGSWTHKQEGRLLETIGWLPHLDQIEEGFGGGRIHCYYDWGQDDPSTPHWTVQWSGEIGFEGDNWETSPPLIHLAVYGDEVLVLYAPPPGFNFWHPGSPDDCQNVDPVPAHRATSSLWFYLEDADVERAPDADTATENAIQEGILLMSIPIDTLRMGTTQTNAVSVSGTQPGDYGTYDWSLKIALTLSSSPEAE